MCTETEPSSIHLEGETSLLQHPELPDAHDTGASTWRGRDDITYLQPCPYHLSPKGISIPSSSLTHYSKHCLVPAQHVPVTLAPARGARRPCPSLTTPRHSTAVDLWDSFFSHSCKPVPLFTASMCGFCVQVKSHGLQLQTSPLRPGKRLQCPPSPAPLPACLCSGLSCAAASSTQQLEGRCPIQPPGHLPLHLNNDFPSQCHWSLWGPRRTERPVLSTRFLGAPFPAAARAQQARFSIDPIPSV